MLEKSVQLISLNQQGKFEINEEAVILIKKLNQTKNIGIVSILGKYRTGKSYLLNKVILNQKQFQIGNSVNACTKGIWIYIMEEQEKFIFVLDTEGLYSTDMSKQQDCKLFLLSILLSSSVIYNSIGVIDENSLTDFGLILNYAKELQGQYSLPYFHWVLRDFSLQQRNKEGQIITAKEYLDEALKDQKGISDQIENKNQIRRLFKSFFQDRDCSCLIRPAESEKSIQMLDDLTDYQLRPEFLQQVQQLKIKLTKKISTKTINNKPISASIFLDMCVSFIQQINQNSIPTLNDTWSLIQHSIASQIKNKIKNQINQIQNDINAQQLQELKYNIKNQIQKEIKLIDCENIRIQSQQDLKQLLKQKLSSYKDIINDQEQKNIKESTKDQIQIIEKKLKSFQYESFFDFQQELQTFIENQKQYHPYFNVIKMNLYQLACDCFIRDLQNKLNRSQINNENSQQQKSEQKQCTSQKKDFSCQVESDSGQQGEVKQQQEYIQLLMQQNYNITQTNLDLINQLGLKNVGEDEKKRQVDNLQLGKINQIQQKFIQTLENQHQQQTIEYENQISKLKQKIEKLKQKNKLLQQNDNYDQQNKYDYYSIQENYEENLEQNISFNSQQKKMSYETVSNSVQKYCFLRNRSQTQQHINDQLQVDIPSYQKSSDNNQCDFTIKCSYQNKQWVINRKLYEFRNLYYRLSTRYNLQFPQEFQVLGSNQDFQKEKNFIQLNNEHKKNLLIKFLNFASKDINEDLQIFLEIGDEFKSDSKLNDMTSFLQILSTKGVENKKNNFTFSQQTIISPKIINQCNNLSQCTFQKQSQNKQ